MEVSVIAAGCCSCSDDDAAAVCERVDAAARRAHAKDVSGRSRRRCRCRFVLSLL